MSERSTKLKIDPDALGNFFQAQLSGTAETETGFEALFRILNPGDIGSLCRSSKKLSTICKSKKWFAKIRQDFPVLSKHLSKFWSDVGDNPTLRSWNWVRFKEYTPASRYFFLQNMRDYLENMTRKLEHFEEKVFLAGFATLTDEDYAIYEVENPFDLLRDYRERIDLPIVSSQSRDNQPGLFEEQERRETVTNNLNLLIWLSLHNDEDYKGKPQYYRVLSDLAKEDLYTRYEGTPSELLIQSVTPDLHEIEVLSDEDLDTYLYLGEAKNSEWPEYAKNINDLSVF